MKYKIGDLVEVKETTDKDPNGISIQTLEESYIGKVGVVVSLVKYSGAGYYHVLIEGEEVELYEKEMRLV